MRKVQEVVRMNGPVGWRRTEHLKGVVEKVPMLVRERKRMSWNIAALVWTEHVAHNGLWRSVGVEKDTPDEVVLKDLLDDVTVIVETGLVWKS